VNLTFVSSTNSGISLSGSNVVVAPGMPAGSYTLTYKICEVLNASNCDNADVTVTVAAAPTVACYETATFNPATCLYNITGTQPVEPVHANCWDTYTFNTTTCVWDNNNTPQPVEPVHANCWDTYTFNTTTCVWDNNNTPQPPMPILADNETATFNTTTCAWVVSVTVYLPSLELLKIGTYVDSSLPAGVSVGDTINYNFTVTNTGNVSLTNVTITDPLVAVVGGPIATLAVGAVDATTFTAIYTITQADIDAGQVNNTATASGTPPSGANVTAVSSDPTPCPTCEPVVGCPTCTSVALVTSPRISLIKTAEFNDNNGDGYGQVGETITYNFTVTNTGNVTITNITILDPLPGIVITGGSITLVPGQVDSTTFEGIYTLTAQDLINGIVTNQAQVVGTTPSGQVAQDLSDNQNNINDNPTVINISGCVIEVFNFISSNGSPGSNDIFKIAGIDCYPDNTVEIYNRWGVLVFETKGYDNTSRVFNGISNGRVTINQNSRLPDGTYFYVLRYKNFTGGNIEKAGYLYIKN
jgi:uncharacterized repeat protein (TIGR01451 family)/gliding motility-associated-like protein